MVAVEKAPDLMRFFRSSAAFLLLFLGASWGVSSNTGPLPPTPPLGQISPLYVTSAGGCKQSITPAMLSNTQYLLGKHFSVCPLLVRFTTG